MLTTTRDPFRTYSTSCILSRNVSRVLTAKHYSCYNILAALWRWAALKMSHHWSQHSSVLDCNVPYTGFRSLVKYLGAEVKPLGRQVYWNNMPLNTNHRYFCAQMPLALSSRHLSSWLRPWGQLLLINCRAQDRLSFFEVLTFDRLI